MSIVLELQLSFVANFSNCDIWVKLSGKSFHSVCHMFEGTLCDKCMISYFKIIYYHKIPAQVQLKEICINTTHTRWTKFKNVNKILNELSITSCCTKMGKKSHVTSNCVQCYTDILSCTLWYSKFINQIIS